MKIGVILVHGIGDQKEDWAELIVKKIEKEMLNILVDLLHEKAPTDINDVVTIKSVYWQGVLEERQGQLRSILKEFDDKSKKNIVGRLARFFRKKLRVFQSNIISNYIGDMIGYMKKDTRPLIYPKITDVLQEIIGEFVNIGEKIPLTFISHSLGTVISSDYIYDLQDGRLLDKDIRERVCIENFFTLGSPIALFALKYGGAEAFDQPVHVESKTGRWINIYDEDDPVGMPLKSLNDAYKQSVFMDVHLNAGFYAISHTKYFEEPETINIISRKIALDWITKNNILEEEKTKELYAIYENDLKLTQKIENKT